MGISAQQYRVRTGVFSSRNLAYHNVKTKPEKLYKNRNSENSKGGNLTMSSLLLVCLVFMCANSSPASEKNTMQTSHCNYRTFSTGSCQIINHNFVAK